MASLYVRSLQPATSVATACTGNFTGKGSELAISSGNSFQLWRFVSGEPELAAEVPTHEHIDQIVALQSPTTSACYLLVLTSDARCTLLKWQDGAFATMFRAAVSLPGHSDAAVLRRVSGTQLSQPFDLIHKGSQMTVIAAAAYTGCIHFLQVSWQKSGKPAAMTVAPLDSALEVRPGVHAPPVDVNYILDLQFVPQPHATGSAAGVHHLALLHVNTQSWGAVASVQSIAWDPAGHLSLGPWTMRNIDPSTSLLCPVSKSPSSAQVGIAAISPHAAILFSNGSTSAIPLDLSCRPCCSAHLGNNCYVIGDSMGGLCLLKFQGERGCAQRIDVQGPVTLPSVLCHLPDWVVPSETGEQQAVLFVGSHGGNSQLVGVPNDPTLPSGRGGAAPLVWPVLDAAFVDSLAPVQDAVVFHDPPGSREGRLLMCCGLAPSGTLRLARLAVGLQPAVTDGPRIPGRPQMTAVGAPGHSEIDAYIAFSFEAGSSTSLLRVSGTHFQQVQLEGLVYDSATLLLAALPNDRLVQVTPQEVRIVADDAAGQLLASWQPAQGPISGAAVHGRHLAVASGSAVFLLEVHDDDVMDKGDAGQPLHCRQQLDYIEQISALAWLDLSHQASGEPSADPWLAVGQWMTNDVLLRPLSSLTASMSQPTSASSAAAAPTSSLHVTAADSVALTLSGGQPRSIVSGMLHGHHFLFVGTSSGEVVYCELLWPAAEPAVSAGPAQTAGGMVWDPLGGSSGKSPPAPQSSSGSHSKHSSGQQGGGAQRSTAANSAAQRSLRIGACRQVVAGLSEVDLFWVPARGGAPAHVYARSDQSLLLRAVDQDIGTGCAMDHVEVVRVHGADGMTSITPIHTPELPASMAWLSTAGMLMFGALEHDLKLRWQTANLGDAPTHLAHDPSSGCAVVLTESPEGVSWLRVVHATSLRQVAGVQLAAGHQALAVCTAALPCSSVSASNPGEKPAATKEFVIVSSCLSSERGEQPAAAAASMPTTNGSGAASGGSGGGPAAPSASSSQQQGTAALVGSERRSARQANAALEGQGESAEAASTSGRVSGDGLQRLTSVLSFFEVRVTAHEAGQQKRYELVLHGTFTVPALCHCLAGCADARSTYSNAQVLLLGCHDGQVRMYQAFVDDAAQAGPHSLASAVATLTRVPPLQPSGPGPNPQPTACGNGPASLPAGNGVGENGRQPDWRQRVTLRLLGQAETLAGTNVSSLAAYGATVVAADFLGSVSVMRAAPGGPVPLLTVAADRTPLYAQALLAISDTLTLVAAHPYGLVLMERDSEAELRAEADKLKLDEAAFEAGRARPGEAFQQPHEAQGRAEDADVDVEGVARRAREAFIQPLRYVAACDRSQMITHFCRGRLGVQPEECSVTGIADSTAAPSFAAPPSTGGQERFTSSQPSVGPLKASSGRGHSASSSAQQDSGHAGVSASERQSCIHSHSNAASTSAPPALPFDRAPVLYVTSAGGVGSAQLITPDELRTLRAIHYEGLETSQDEIWPVATYDSFDGYIEHPRVAPKPRPGPSGQMDPLTPYDHVCYYNRPAAEWVPPSLGPGYRRDFDDDEDENADEPEDWVEQRFRMKMLMEDLVETAIDADLADALHAPKHKRLPLWLDAPDQLAGQLKAFTDAFVDR